LPDARFKAIDNLTITHGSVGINLGGFGATEVDLSDATVTENGSGIICQTLGCGVALTDSSVSGNTVRDWLAGTAMPRASER
jgi:hypothetical protein